MTGAGPTQTAGNAESRGPVVLAQHPTGIAGLDQVLRGGLPVGGAYLVAGTPGTGKTTLGNQLAFAHAGHGGTSIFATLPDAMTAPLVLAPFRSLQLAPSILLFQRAGPLSAPPCCWTDRKVAAVFAA